MHTIRVTTKNRLLAALPQSDYERLLPSLGPVRFDLGQVIYAPGQNLGYIHFPTTCVISLPHVIEDGLIAEAGLVGNEGAVGIALFLGGETRPIEP
jgi:hypothetical protein